MTCPYRLATAFAIFALAGFAVQPSTAQPRAVAAPARTTPAARPAAAPAAGAARPAAAATGGTAAGWHTVGPVFRKLAPGVMQDVVYDRKAAETIERNDLTELLYMDDTFAFAKNVTFRQEVWMLEIKYKPVRMIWADIPGPGGRMQRKQIWYMVYQVTNPGKVFRSVVRDDNIHKLATVDPTGVATVATPTEDNLYRLVSVDKPVRFAPVFTLEVHKQLQDDTPDKISAQIEQYIPIALPAIRAREDKNREFLTSEQMPLKELKVGETAWGVATWQDVDPRNVWFSVYIEGLTNAYRFKDDSAKYAAFKKQTSTAMFREIGTKVLKINFWRPGDEFTVKEQQVREGVPQLPGGPALKPSFEWVWWRTFPNSGKVVPPPYVEDRATP